MSDRNDAPITVTAKPAMGSPQPAPTWTLTEKARLIFQLIILLAALIIIIQNWTWVDVNILFLLHFEAPVTLLLAITFILGMFVGWLTPIIRAHRKRNAQ